ncbi:MAG: hypothetical protein ACXAC7_07970 [Candidatus Hodarchaeales archaeon]|jgi:hypothetical protein
MGISTLQSNREQAGLKQFTFTANNLGAKTVNWTNYGTSLEIWAHNDGNRILELSFDDGDNWWELPGAGIDIYRHKVKSMLVRKQSAGGSCTLRFIVMFANPVPKPPLAPGQADDGKVR